MAGVKAELEPLLTGDLRAKGSSIARRAYEIELARGGAPGRELEAGPGRREFGPSIGR